MTGFVIRVPVRNGRDPRSVTAHETGTPGLVIHPHLTDKGTFVLTHLRSGAAICHDESREALLHIAELIGPLADWTKCGEDLHPDIDLRVRVQDVLFEAGNRLLYGGKGVVRADLNLAAS